jgi:hypothetical protein
MKISQIKRILGTKEEIEFRTPTGKRVPEHFHVTEIGKISKIFIDCGGTMRKEEIANFQLWNANDYSHRLHPEKLLDIIELSEKILELGDLEIEVEYQGDTIGKYGLDFVNGHFLLTNTQTDCLAKDKCGIPTQELSVGQSAKKTASGCSPQSGCC